MWIDRFTEFERGSHATAVKCITLAEEHLHDHYPGFPVMPGSLIAEGLAQTGGILLGELNDFEHVVILAKIPKLEFHSWACPGEMLTYKVKLLDSSEQGGMVACTAMIGDRLVAEGEIVFAHVDKASPEAVKIDQKNFVFSMNLLGVMDVGKAGSSLGNSTNS